MEYLEKAWQRAIILREANRLNNFLQRWRKSMARKLLASLKGEP